jgi:hypothetical protein
MRLQNGRPVVATFRQPDGKTGPWTFLEGSSVRHGAAVSLRPEFHAIFAAHYSMGNFGKIETCGGEAYEWNIKTETFDYSKRLSKRIGKDFCHELPTKLNCLHRAPIDSIGEFAQSRKPTHLHSLGIPVKYPMKRTPCDGPAVLPI